MWKQLVLFENGRKMEAGCAEAKRTCEIVEVNDEHFEDFCVSVKYTWPNILQFESMKIRRYANLMYYKNGNWYSIVKWSVGYNLHFLTSRHTFLPQLTAWAVAKSNLAPSIRALMSGRTPDPPIPDFGRISAFRFRQSLEKTKEKEPERRAKFVSGLRTNFWVGKRAMCSSLTTASNTRWVPEHLTHFLALISYVPSSQVWHNGSSGIRLVLLIDMWHPELTQEDRKKLTPLPNSFEASEVENADPVIDVAHFVWGYTFLHAEFLLHSLFIECNNNRAPIYMSSLQTLVNRINQSSLNSCF